MNRVIFSSSFYSWCTTLFKAYSIVIQYIYIYICNAKWLPQHLVNIHHLIVSKTQVFPCDEDFKNFLFGNFQIHHMALLIADIMYITSPVPTHLTTLYLVTPAQFPPPEAASRSHLFLSQYRHLVVVCFNSKSRSRWGKRVAWIS